MDNTSQYIRFQIHKRSVGVAIVFCLVFGMLGVHRFYLGRDGTGAAMLVLSLTIVGMPIAWLWSIVDLFLISSMVREHNIRLADRLEDFYVDEEEPPRRRTNYKYRNV